MQRFSDMMDEMCYIVATKHGGSLKGEHSTGRNMAPYVELEWGRKAYDLMWELKQMFDPADVLNPGADGRCVRQALANLRLVICLARQRKGGFGAASWLRLSQWPCALQNKARVNAPSSLDYGCEGSSSSGSSDAAVS